MNLLLHKTKQVSNQNWAHKEGHMTLTTDNLPTVLNMYAPYWHIQFHKADYWV